MSAKPSSERGRPLPTAAELDILAVLWRLGPATVREIHDELGKGSGYTTTQKQMQLMLGKSLLVRTERFGVHVYEAGIPKEQTQKQIVGDLLNRVFEGSSSTLVMRALAAKSASSEELDEIRRMIETASQKKRLRQMNALQMLASEPWVTRLGWALIHFLWQGAFIASVYAVARIRVRSPRVRYLLACTAMVAMTVAPFITFVREGSSASVAGHSKVSTSPSAAHNEWSTTPAAPAVPEHSLWPDQIMSWLVLAWFAGVAGFWLRLTAEWIFITRLRSAAVRAAPPEWQRTLHELSARIRISRPVKFLISPQVEVPSVLGWMRPVVLMPIGALAGLPAEHIEAILAHELAHIRRHDYLVNILQTIAEAMWFYHPGVWWISSQIRREREHCCDDIAVSVTGDAIVFAQALLTSSRTAYAGPALAATGGSLKDRIARLLGVQSRDRRIAWAPAVGAAGALLFFAVAAMLAQQATSKPAFEVASVKPSPPDQVGFQSYVRGDRYTALTATVRDLMAYAYGIREFQISDRPAWTSSEHYNISATISDVVVTTNQLGFNVAEIDQSKLMLQTLLADRFGLRFHRITKNRAGYALVVDKGGPKLAEKAHPGLGLGIDLGRLDGHGADMRSLTVILSSQLGVPIADRTGLQGFYDFHLVWSPDDEARDETVGAAGPSVFTAVKEQLGLRLDPVKDVPIELFVIDQVHKPSEN